MRIKIAARVAELIDYAKKLDLHVDVEAKESRYIDGTNFIVTITSNREFRYLGHQVWIFGNDRSKRVSIILYGSNDHRQKKLTQRRAVAWIETLALGSTRTLDEHGRLVRRKEDQ